MNSLTIGTSAIQAGERALDLIGQNVANATTPGYHRQSVNLVNSVTGTNGTGVDIASITRYTADPLRAAIVSGNADQASLAAQLSTSRQIETNLGAGQGGVGDQLDTFFNQIEALTAQPNSLASKAAIITSANGLATQFNTTAGSIDQLRANVAAQVPTVVSDVNSLASQIADLNNRILVTQNRGNSTNDLQDQREQLINTLSQKIDIKTVQEPSGEINVIASGSAVVVGQYANKFQSGFDASGNIAITQQAASTPVTFNSGTLGALIQDYNTNIPAVRARLDTLAGQLVQKVNQIQATGLGANGPLASATGTNGVSSPTAVLNSAGLPFPVQAGNLTVSVTNNNVSPSTRTNTTIAIDPATQSLQDIATALNGVTGLQASIDPTTNTLKIQGQSGFTFDFAGRDSNPPGAGAVANPDSSGLLSALGVGGLFSGSNAVGIAVRPEFLADANRLATSTTGQPSDATNLERFAALRDQQVIGNRTLSDDFADQASALGSRINALSDQQTTSASTLSNLNSQEQGVTGVDTNEELLHLLDYQRMVQGASKYLSVVNTAMDSLLAILP